MDTETAIDALIASVRERGYCNIQNVVPATVCPQIRQRMMQVVERERKDTSPDHVGFVPSVINHDQSFADYLADPRLMNVAQTLLGPNLRISFTSVIVNEPGNARGGWHSDWPFNQNNAGHVPVPYPDTTFHLTTLWMLSPFNRQNGGTLVVPGSHRQPSNPTHPACDVGANEPVPTEINVTGSAGDVLLFDSRLWHATSPNATDEPRVALAVRYAPWWLNLEVLRPESAERKWLCQQTGKDDNQVPSIRRDVFEQLPERVQRLYRHWVVD